MLDIQTNAAYKKGKRYLHVRLRPIDDNGLDPRTITGQIHWQDSPPRSKLVTWGRYYPTGRNAGLIPYMKLSWCSSTANVYYTLSAIDALGYGERHNQRDLPFPYDLTDLYNLARFVACNSVPAYALLGWIEDNLPHPWNLLASPEPLDCLAALSPYPLSGV